MPSRRARLDAAQSRGPPGRDVRKFGESSDMHRPAQPEEISPAYVFLAAPSCASYVSGIVLPVMGGPTG